MFANKKYKISARNCALHFQFNLIYKTLLTMGTVTKQLYKNMDIKVIPNKQVRDNGDKEKLPETTQGRP